MNLPKNRLTVTNLPVGACVFLSVFLLRLVILVRLTGSQFLLPEAGDMQFYNNWALRILGGDWTSHTAFYGLPLYAYLLAAIYKICGYSPFVPGLLQAGLEGGTAVVLYKLSLCAFGDKVATEPVEGPSFRTKAIGLLAAIGWALFQPAQAYSVILMPISWLVFVFWFVVYEIVRRKTLPTLFPCLFFGLLIGFTAMGIATILFLIPLVVAAFFLRWKAIFSRRFASVAVFLAGTFLGASPAVTHNYVIARDPIFLSAHGGVNFWIGNNPMATGYPRFPPGLHAGQVAMLQDSITAAEKAAGHPLKRSEVSAFWSQKARAWIEQHPGGWLKLLGLKTQYFWNAFQYDDLSIIETLRDQGVIFPGIRFGLIAALALPGLLLAWGKFPLSRWAAVAVLLHLVSLLSVFITERYRMAAVPGLLLFAAAGVSELWRAGVDANYRRGALYLSLLAVGTWFVSIPQRDSSLWALESYNSGLQALGAHQLTVAERKLDLAYAYVPSNVEVNFALGNLRLAQGNRTAAKEFYFAALRLDPQHERSYKNLGILALEEKRWNLAARLFAHALKENPHDPKTFYLLAQADLKAGDLTTARARIAQALELNPTQPAFFALRNEIEKKMQVVQSQE
ncbi:MAG: tetratricopeptide repeat protein [Chthoniobacterales bacterium]|nr:tetratricopeptide repeat protein [Chthoniobacterales bacterium]